jgi:DNA polymerase-1
LKNVIVDVESDGLLDQLTKLHCVVLRDVDTDEVISCADQPGYTPISEGLKVLQQAETIYGHNIIGFDRAAIKKVSGLSLPVVKVRDTMTVAAMVWNHIKQRDFLNATKGVFPAHLCGNHSLEAWGYRLGIRKGTFGKVARKGLKKAEYEEEKRKSFEKWTPEMQAYCVQDTAVPKALIEQIRKSGVSTEAMNTEHALAWYLAAQEKNGCPFDLKKAQELQAKLAARREEIAQDLKKVFVDWYKPVRHKGEVVVFTAKKANKKRGLEAGAQYTKLTRVEFNPASRQHIANRLQWLYGWKPEAFTPGGQPEINEKTLKGLNQDLPGVKLLMEYLLVEKRLSQLAEGPEAWLLQATNNGPRGGKLTGLHHIHGKVWQSGTITHRASHSNPNLGQVPKVGKPFGAECRELFYVPEGWVLVGADASSLEARVLAHYMHPYDGGAYGELLLKGDVHSKNRDALGLPATKDGRDKAKTWLYAFLYGAGDEKLGSILDPGASPAKQKKLGEKARKKFLQETPALRLLIEAVKVKAKKQGYLTTIDGRRVYVRSEHASLNTLCQTAGAIICKKWIANFSQRFEEEFGEQGWDGKWSALLWVHDEVQIACRPEIVERAKQILVEEIRKLTQHYKWRVELDGEAKAGRNWKETH